MDYYNNLPIKDCSREMNDAMALVVCVGALLLVMFSAAGWCQDPVQENLQNKVRDLEYENEALLNSIENMKEESNTLSRRLSRATQSLENLRSALEMTNRTDDEILGDTQG